MHHPRGALRRPLLWLSLALLGLNVALAWRLFHTEYLSQMGTMEGVYIAYARYARDHWPDLAWCRFWYAGLPFQNAYVPGLHYTVAAASALARISPAAALHFVVALMYSLGPVTLFWMALRLTGSLSGSFCAAVAYSLMSPSAFLAPEIHLDLGSLFYAQRLHTLVAYSDSPHVTSLTLLPFAILALDVALARRRALWYVLAALALAAVPLTNWPGAIVLAFAVLAYGLTLAGGARSRLLIVGLAVLGYCFVAPWMPPSTILKTQADTQILDPVNRFTPHHLLYVAALVAGTLLLLRLFKIGRGLPRYLRFFLLFFFYMGAITLSKYWFGIIILAQAHRFHLAMEMALTLSVVFTLRLSTSEWPVLRKALTTIFVVFCLFQFVQYRLYARKLIRGIDITRTSEYKTAMWFDQHMREGRVMVPGSTTFWLNAFTDTPQMTGCCEQGVVNQTIRAANYGITTDLTAENRAFENSLLWFKALGVRAVAVSGPRSTEVYKPFFHPGKFEGRLPVLWRDGDDVIYEVPGPYSLAHAIYEKDLVQRRPIHGVDTAPLVPYVAAVTRPDALMALHWLNNETIRIDGNLQPNQLVSVQVTAHPGWHAAVGGSPRRVFPDKLGFLTVAPQCAGPCTINLHYDGGAEMQIARWLQLAALIGALLWILAAQLSRASAGAR